MTGDVNNFGEQDVQAERVKSFEVFVATRQGLVTLIRTGPNSDDGESKELENSIGDTNFQKLGEAWLEAVLGFFEAFPLFGSVAHYVHLHQASENFVPLLERICESAFEEPESESREKKKTYVVGLEHIHSINRKVSALNRFKRAERSLLRAQLLAIVSEYEAFMCDMLRVIISLRPEAFISRDATVLASDVIRANSVEAIKTYLIEERIDSIQRESHVDQIALIYDRLKLAPPDQKSIREFGQVCECRNLLTHADGRVNRQYISRLKKLGFEDKDIPALGTELEIDEHYIKRSAARIFLMGYFTLHIVWQHLVKEESQRSISQLINCSHEFLLTGYTKMATRVCDFIRNAKSPANEVDRAYAIINSALAVRLDMSIPETEKAQKIETILKARDWSIVDPLFKLALACVRGQLEKLPNLIENAIQDGLKSDALLTWALFSHVRKEKFFRDCMVKHFGIVLEEPAQDESADELVTDGAHVTIDVSAARDT